MRYCIWSGGRQNIRHCRYNLFIIHSHVHTSNLYSAQNIYIYFTLSGSQDVHNKILSGQYKMISTLVLTVFSRINTLFYCALPYMRFFLYGFSSLSLPTLSLYLFFSLPPSFSLPLSLFDLSPSPCPRSLSILSFSLPSLPSPPIMPDMFQSHF